MLPPIIGLTGPAGSGKDTTARLLATFFQYRQKSFADPIRAGLSTMLGIDPTVLQNRESKEQPLGNIDRSPRELMQTLGTEWGRNRVHPDVWILAMRAWRQNAQPARHVIADVRFPNEAEWIRSEGGTVILVRRDVRALEGTHQSEAYFSELAPDAVIDNTGNLHRLGFAVLRAVAEVLQPPEDTHGG